VKARGRFEKPYDTSKAFEKMEFKNMLLPRGNELSAINSTLLLVQRH